jgi:hypothetical protein
MKNLKIVSGPLRPDFYFIASQDARINDFRAEIGRICFLYCGMGFKGLIFMKRS